MNQRFRVLQELGEQFEHASQAADLAESRSAWTGTWLPAIVLRLSISRRRFWPVVGAAGVALTAAIVTTVVLLSSGAPAAAAGWAPVPTTPTPAALATAVTKCYKVGSQDTGLGEPVLTEARGESTAAINVIDGQVALCLYNSALPAVSIDRIGPLHAAPGPDQLGVPYSEYAAGISGRLPAWLRQQIHKELTSGAKRPTRATFKAMMAFHQQGTFSDGYGYWVVGQAGSDVSAVTFAFTGHETVTASVQNGWYFAWWPWLSDPTSVTVITSTGTSTSVMKNASPDGLESRPYPACQPGSNGCAFVNTPPAPSTTSTSPVATTAQSCDEFTDALPPDAFAGQPVLSYVHGAYTAVLDVTGGVGYICLTGGDQKDIHAFYMLDDESLGRVRSAPGPDQLSVPYWPHDGGGTGRPIGMTPKSQLPETPAQREATSARLDGGGYGPYMLGQAGSDVAAVTFTFANGQAVAATVQNGWYFAWWPWTSDPTSVTVTTNSGTSTSPMRSGTDLDRPLPGCQPGSTGCAFVNTPPALSTHTTSTTTTPTPSTATTTTP